MLCPLKIHCVSLLENAVGQAITVLAGLVAFASRPTTFDRGVAGMLCSLKILAGAGLPVKVRSQAAALLAEGGIREGRNTSARGRARMLC
jgi:hypothetical protein